MNIWMYWEGRKRPPWLNLCLDTVHKHLGNNSLHIISKEDAPTYMQWIPEQWDNLPPAIRAGIFRVHALYMYGGLWLDFDTIVLQPLQKLFDLLEEHKYIGFGHNHRLCNGVMASVKQGTMITKFLNEQKKCLAGAVKIEWGTIGVQLQRKICKEYPDAWHNHPAEKSYPVLYEDWEVFLHSNVNPSLLASVCAADVVPLFNKYMSNLLSGISREHLLKSDMLLSHLYRKALGNA